MAGHSKWANIKFRKAAQDQKRGKIFTKIIRELTIAARAGGSDPNSNSRLRLAIDKAYTNNMSKQTVEKAIKKGAGELDAENYEEIVYEGYGPAGVAVMVECMTDNRNRTVSEVRHAFSKCGGNLGTDGSVAYLFHKKGLISFPTSANEEKIIEVALELGADDVVTNTDGSIDVMTTMEDYITIKEALGAAGLEPGQAQLTMIASVEVPVDNKDTAEKLLRLLDMLEELDDVQEVYSNADIAEEIMLELEKA